MFGVKFVLAFALIFLVSSSSANQLVEDLAIKVTALEQEVQTLKNKNSGLEAQLQGLTNRLNGAKVECVDKTTHWQEYADAPIVYLDRQNVECPHPYSMSKLHLIRNGDLVAYAYRCCKFVI